MRRILLIVSLLLMVTTAVAQDPFFLFEGVVPMAYQTLQAVPPALYVPEGHALTPTELQNVLDLRHGDRAVLIRDGAIVAEATIGAVVAQKRDDAHQDRVLYVRLEGLPEEVTMSTEPRGLAALTDAAYDLIVVTDKPVEVLAREPRFEGLRWGTHDYVVRAGRIRYAISRENDFRADGFRGWQVSRIEEERTARLTADYTWWRR